MKKFLGVLLAALLLFSCLSVSASAYNAQLSPQNLKVDISKAKCEVYNIDGYNYFKLRDLAYLLNGSGSQFSVGFDAASQTATVTTGSAYTGAAPGAFKDNSATAQKSAQTILVNGVKQSGIQAYNIGGYNFFKLRDLSTLIGFTVDYDDLTKTMLVYSAFKDTVSLPDIDSSYPVEQHFDPITKMISTSYAGNEPVDITCTVPYITGVPAKDDINLLMSIYLEAFWSSKENEMLEPAIEEYAPLTSWDEPYYWYNDGFAEKVGNYVSITIPYEWYMGGVLDFGESHFVCDANTGDIVNLRAFYPGKTDKQITDSILSIIRADLRADDFMNLEGTEDYCVCNYSVDDFDFFLRDGDLYVQFDKYELSYGGAGSFEFYVKSVA